MTKGGREAALCHLSVAPSSATDALWFPLLRSAKRSFFEPRDQARRVPAAAAKLLHLRVELIDEGRDRQARAILARFVEADRQVLAHPIDGKAEIEGAGDHRLVAVLHL